MREIKFRAWNKNRNMFIIDGMTPKEIQDDATQSMQLPMMTSEDCVWQQYTGLKDKNGIEIYEGDVIEYCISEPETATVTFEHGVFWGDYPLYEVVEEKYFCKVIGNIFEGVDNKTLKEREKALDELTKQAQDLDMGY